MARETYRLACQEAEATIAAFAQSTIKSLIRAVRGDMVCM
jgi:hypothetical protein